MKIETIICDRCGKECKNMKSNHGFHVYKKKLLLENVYKYKPLMDLCQDCYDSLSNWMKAGKAESEDK